MFLDVIICLQNLNLSALTRQGLITIQSLIQYLFVRSEEYLRDMWHRVRKEDPVMLSNFENFISKMAADLKESARERMKLQYTMNR